MQLVEQRHPPQLRIAFFSIDEMEGIGVGLGR